MSLDFVFADLTAASSPDDLCSAASLAAARAARSDLALSHIAPVLASNEATIAYLRDPETRGMLETWIASYRHDEELLAALADDVRAVVLASGWRAYEATMMQARDAARVAA